MTPLCQVLITAGLIAPALALTAGPAHAQDATFSDCETCPTMQPVPSGSAMLGHEPHEANVKRGDLPLREVSIDYALAVSAHEVTVGQFRAFIEATGYELLTDGCNTWAEGRILGYVKHHDWSYPGYPQNETHPVVCVSYDDATAYANWLSETTGKPYRLPTSTEFEYATRAGTRGPWFWGPANRDACTYANVADRTFRRNFVLAPLFDCDDGYEYTAPVGSFEPNEWGLYDMLGNAWEWTEDCGHFESEAPPPVDGRAWLAEDDGDCSRRIPRGGSWVSGSDWVRAAAQAGDRAIYHSQLLGFRVALTLDE